MRRDVLQHNANVALGCLALLVAVTWIVTQVNLLPIAPGQYAAMGSILMAASPGLAIYWGGAMGFGALLHRVTLGEWRAASAAGAGLGFAAMLLAGWLAAWAGLLNGVTAWALPGVGCVAWVVVLLRGRAKPQACDEGQPWSWAVLLWMPGLGLLLVAACCPPGTIWRTEAFGYDVLSYHLQVVREWLATGAMVELPHNVYSYLPGLFESGFLHVSAMHGSVRDAVYACQLLHVAAALLAAANVASIVRRMGGAVAGLAAGGVLLAVPWVVVTGSLAYNEMAALALGAAGLNVALSDKPRGAAAGLLCGAATLCKLTAGPMLAVPVGVVMLMQRQWRAAVLAGIVGFVTLSPYFARNAIWTGNPVFPFATTLLGRGHWNDELAGRWQRGHFASQEDAAGRFDALRRQWLLNTGYGAVGGSPTPREVKNIARFAREGGVPLLWIAVAAGGALAAWRGRRRAVVGRMAAMVVIQVGFWLFATHMQSRFLVVTLLPAAVVAGVGLTEVEETLNRKRGAGPLAGAALVVAMMLLAFGTMLEQTQTIVDERTRQRVNLLPVALIDSLDVIGTHTINRALPPESRGDVKVYLVADNSRLLYIDRPTVYHSAFDANPLGELIRSGDQVNAGLRAMGVTHVWVHWQELDRLHDTYGFDRDVTRASLARLIDTGWRTVEDVPGVATLYALPQEP